MISNKTLLSLSLIVLSLSGCGYKTPDCSDSDVKKVLSKEIAGNVIRAGAIGFTIEDITKRVSIVDVQTTNRNEKLDTYTCKAAYTYSFPSGSYKTLFKLATDEDFRNKTQTKLIKDFGEMKGGMIIEQFKQTLGTMLMTAQSDPSLQGRNDTESLEKFQKAVKDAFEELTDSSHKSFIDYSISTVKNGKDSDFSVNWKSADDVIYAYALFSVLVKYAD